MTWFRALSRMVVSPESSAIERRRAIGYCSEMAVRGKLETVPPAGLLSAPPSRGLPLLKSGAAKTT